MFCPGINKVVVDAFGSNGTVVVVVVASTDLNKAYTACAIFVSWVLSIKVFDP